MPKPKRRNADPITPVGENPDNDPLPVQELAPAMEHPPLAIVQDAPAVAETTPAPTKSWSTGPNPFSSIGYYWADYTIRYQENTERNEVQIKFGDGSVQDKPKNFEQIERLLRANGLRWNPKDKAWGLGLEWQVKNSEEGAAQTNEQVRRRNAKKRADVENLLPEIVRLEEEVRGPTTGKSQKPPATTR